MAKVSRDTAKRQLDELFKRIPAEGFIELTQKESVPPANLSAIVRIEISAKPSEPEAKAPAKKSARKPAKKGPPDADVPGQSKANVGGRDKRKRGQTGKGSA